MARLNAMAGREKRPGDPEPASLAAAPPLIVMICAALVAAVIVRGLIWMNRSPTFGGERTPIAQAK